MLNSHPSPTTSYNSVQNLTHPNLGTQISHHPAAEVRLRGNLISGSVLLILGLLVLATSGLAALNQTGLAVVSVCGGVGLLSLAAGGWALWTYTQEKDMAVTLFTEGLQVTRNGRSQTIRWDEVARLNVSVVYNAPIGAALYTYLLTPTAGEQLRLNLSEGNLIRPDVIAETIQQEVTSRQLYTATTALNAGQRIGFGPFAISAAGLHAGEELLPWSEVLKVNISRHGRLIAWSHSGPTAWASAELPQVENVFTLLVLADRLTQAYR